MTSEKWVVRIRDRFSINGILEPKRVTHSVNLPAASRGAITSVQAYFNRLGYHYDVERWTVSLTTGIERVL